MRLKCYLLSFAVVLETILGQFFVVPSWATAPEIAQSENLNSSELPLEMQLRQAKELRDRNEFAAAIAVYLEILQKDPQQRQAREELALTYAYNQEYENSIRLYKALIAEEPQNVDLQLQLARVTSWKGDYQQAIALYEAVLAQDPNNLAASLGRAEVLSWAEQYTESAKAYEAILQRDPKNLQAQLGIAQVLTYKTQYDQSIAAYQEILKQNPGNLQAQLGIAQVLTYKEQYDQSIAAYQEILQQYPNSVEALQGQAQVTYYSGRPQQAIILYQKAIERFPQSQELRLGLARVYYAQQKIRAILPLIQPLVQRKNQEALQLLHEIQAVHISTDFHGKFRNSGESNLSTQLSTRFRIDNSDTVQKIQTGFNYFEQRNFDNVINIPIQVGIEGNINQIALRGAVGVDLFNRLPTALNFNAEADIPITPNLTLSGVLEQGPYKYNAETLENQITALRLGPNLNWQIDRNTNLFASFRWGSYNDSNTEQQIFVNLERKLGQFFIGGYLFNWSYKEDPENGYFAPPNYLLYSGVLGWEGDITNFLQCRLSAALGEQRFQDENEIATVYQFLCSTKVSPDLEADLGYSYSNTQNEAGRNADHSQEVIGRLRFTF